MRAPVHRASYETDFGRGWLVADGDALVQIVLPGGEQPDAADASSPILERWSRALEAYFDGTAVCPPSRPASAQT